MFHLSTCQSHLPVRFSDPVGIISRSKREELLAEQERALEREDVSDVVLLVLVVQNSFYW